MVIQDSYSEFALTSIKAQEKLIGDYNNELGKVRNKAKAHRKFLQEFVFAETRQVCIDMDNNSNFLNKIFELEDDDNSKTFEQHFNDEFEKVVSKDKHKLLEHLAYYNALGLFKEFWEEQDSNYVSADEEELPTESEEYEEETKSPLFWTGTNETEFVQFVYGLYCAKRITNDEKQITKLVPQFAKLLNFDLGEFWQSNHTDSIHNRKPEYKVELFENIDKAYSDYCTKQINKKKKN
jgi:hypothetical protein